MFQRSLHFSKKKPTCFCAAKCVSLLTNSELLSTCRVVETIGLNINCLNGSNLRWEGQLSRGWRSQGLLPVGHAHQHGCAWHLGPRPGGFGGQRQAQIWCLGLARSRALNPLDGKPGGFEQKELRGGPFGVGISWVCCGREARARQASRSNGEGGRGWQMAACPLGAANNPFDYWAKVEPGDHRF